MMHEFTLVLDGVTDLDEDLTDAIFEAGCDDGTPGYQAGVISIDFDREADDLESAIVSAIRDVEGADYPVGVSHVEPDDFVNASEIARRMGATREYVRLLSCGERGPGGFPIPHGGVFSPSCRYSWSAVCRWLIENDYLADRQLLCTAETIRNVNAVLEQQRRTRDDKRRMKRLREALTRP